MGRTTKSIIASAATFLLLSTSLLVIAPFPPFDGPNHMGFAASSPHQTIGSTFTTTAWVDIHKAIDAVSIDNLTFQPAGILYYSPPTAQGNMWTSPYVWITPESDIGGTTNINNASGYAYPIVEGKNSVNSTNKTLATITWMPVSCGKVTLSITAGGTALLMDDVGTTMHTLDIWVHPMDVSSLSVTRQGSTQLNLNWMKNTGDSKTLIRYKSGSSPTSVTDGTLLYNDTGTSTSQYGLAPGETVYYSAWGWNASGQIYSQLSATGFGTTDTPPSIGTPSPANSSINQPFSFTWSIPLSDQNGDTISWTLQCSNGQTSSGSNGNGTANLPLSGLAASTTYMVYVNASDATDTTRAWFEFTTRSEYTPSPPSPFSATAMSRFRIDLSWSKGSLADSTYVEAKQGSYPSSRTDGTFIYNGTGVGTSDMGLSPGQTWYYSAWSWNATDHVFSSTSASASTTTFYNSPPSYGIPVPMNGSTDEPLSFSWSIAIDDPEGDSFSWTIECNNSQTNSGSGGNGTKSLALSGLTFTRWYTVWVNSTDSFGTQMKASYVFETRSQYIPDPPSSFSAIASSPVNINLGWAKGSGGDTTVIFAQLGSAPSGPSGTPLYNGTGTSTSHSVSPGEHWFYIAYSWNNTDQTYSSSYVSADALTPSNHPPNAPYNPSPVNNALYLNVYNIYLNCTVSDPDGGTLSVHYYWGNGTAIGTIYGVSSGGTSSLFLPSYWHRTIGSYSNCTWVTHDTNHSWYAVADDGVESTPGPTWHFSTCKAWDLNVDKTVNYLDVSGLVSHYSMRVYAPGRLPWDINEDTYTNYLDVSGLVSHYNQHY